MDRVFVTLVTTEDFFDGAIALSRSLEFVKSKYPLLLMHSCDLRDDQLHAFDYSIRVNPIPNTNLSDAKHANHANWYSDHAFTKLRIWCLDQIGVVKLVYLDADTIVLKNIDHLFDLCSDNSNLFCFAAAPDIFPPDKFNAGVIVTSPNSLVFARILKICCEIESYDGGDTGLLNSIFPEWSAGDLFQRKKNDRFVFNEIIGMKMNIQRLPFGYNAQRLMNVYTRSKPSYWNHAVDVHVIHYSSNPKPWTLVTHLSRKPIDEIWWKNFELSDLKPRNHSKLQLGSPDNGSMDISGSKDVSFHGNFDANSILKRNLWIPNSEAVIKAWKRNFTKWNIRGNFEADCIPKCIHLIWIGESVPEKVNNVVDLWKKAIKGSNWTLQFWRDSDIEKFRKTSNLVRGDIDYSTLSYVQQSDIIRLELLFKNGGVYLDCDMYPVEFVDSSNNSIDLLSNICSKSSLFFGFSNVGEVEVNNAAIGSIPNHAFIKDMLNQLCIENLPSRSFSEIISSTGPGFVTRQLSKYSENDLALNNAVILSSDYFYPLPNRFRSLNSSDWAIFCSPQTIAIHAWGCSWQSQPTEEKEKPKEEADEKLAKLQNSSISTILEFLG